MSMPHHCKHFVENEKKREPNSEVKCHCCGSFSIPAQQNVTRRVLWVTAKPILTPTVADGIDPRGPRRPETSYNRGRAANSASGMNGKRSQSMHERNKLRGTNVRYAKITAYDVRTAHCTELLTYISNFIFTKIYAYHSLDLLMSDVRIFW